VSINGGGELTARLGFDANVRWGVAISGPGAPAVMANVALTWRVARDWLVLASYYEYRIGSWTDVNRHIPARAAACDRESRTEPAWRFSDDPL